MRKRIVITVSLLMIFLLGSVAGTLAMNVGPRYSYVDLGTLGGDSSYPYALNAHGKAVGGSITALSWIMHAFLWTKKNGVIDLGALNQLGGELADLDRSVAWNLNTRGRMVVGESWNAAYDAGEPNGRDRAFLWRKGKGMQDLGTLGGQNSSAYGCNDQGRVVGSAETASPGIFHAFLWTREKGLQDLDGRPDKYSVAWGINDLNQVAGEAETDSPEVIHGFLWSKHGGRQDLAPLPGDMLSAGYALSLTHICGTSIDATGEPHAVLWNIHKSGVVDLGSLGQNYGYANSLNDLGQVVGTSKTAAGETHAFIWTPVTGMRDLNNLVMLPPDVMLYSASSINNKGQILAFAAFSNGTERSFLLSPITHERQVQGDGDWDRDRDRDRDRD